MKFAEKTKVPTDQSHVEIERTLQKYGATRFAYASEAARAVIMFEAADRRLRLDLPLPEGATDRDAQERRRR